MKRPFQNPKHKIRFELFQEQVVGRAFESHFHGPFDADDAPPSTSSPKTGRLLINEGLESQ